MSNPNPSLPRLANIKEVAKAIGVSTRTVNKLVARGEIPSVKVRGSRRFNLPAVLAALEHGSIPKLTAEDEAALKRTGFNPVKLSREEKRAILTALEIDLRRSGAAS